MRNVFLALFAALVLALTACGTTAPKPATVCAANDTKCDNGNTDNGNTDNGNTDNGNTDSNTDGNNGSNGSTDTTNNGGTTDNNGGNTGNNGGNTGGNGGTTPAPFDHSLMKGIAQGYEQFLHDYKGNQRLTVKALWIDQSNGTIITISQDDNGQGGNWIEKNGEFGIRLQTPSDSALATLPIFSPINCGPDADDVITTTTVPANLSSIQGLIVPVLFVFDGDQVVGLIVHGSFYFDNYGQLEYPAKLAMRVYSAADKVIAKGTCSGDMGMNALMSLVDPTFAAALSDVGVGGASSLTQSMMMSSQEPASPGVSLKVDMGLKKGWNTIVLSGSVTDNGSLELSLIDDTQPNFTWYFISLADYIPDLEPEQPVDPECPEVVPFNNTGEPPLECPVPVEEPVLQ